MKKNNRINLKRFTALLLAIVLIFGSFIHIKPLYAEADNSEEVSDQANDTLESQNFDVKAEEEILEDLVNTTIEAEVYTDSSYIFRKHDSKITLSGYLPKGASAKAYEAKVEVNDDTEKLLVAYDIVIFDKVGNIFEPADDSPIKVSIKNKKITEAKEINVYHMEDENSPEEEVVKNEKNEDTVSFDAKSFSVYLITEKQTHTYIFKDLEGEVEEKVYKQIIKDDEKLYEPKAPEIENKKFVAWEVFEDDKRIGDLSFENGSISSIITPITENKEFNVIARYEDVVYIHFMDSTGEDARVFTTKETVPGGEIKLDDINLPLDSKKAVTGWYEDKDLKNKSVANPYKVSKSIKLYPKIEDGHYIYFQTDGGTYIKPQFVTANGVTLKPEAPTKPGYKFSHWSLSKDGSPYSFGQVINEDIILYAVWEGVEVQYDVIIWKQSINDDKNASNKTYDFEEAVTRSAKTGSIVDPIYDDIKKNYEGFHYEKSDTNVEVKGDGTTIVNVYYDRDLMTIRFHSLSYTNPWYPTYINSDTYTGLYGQTLSQNGYTWPNGIVWSDQSGSGGTVTTFLDAFIFTTDENEFKLYNRGSESGRIAIKHYKQNLDGNYPNTPANTNYSNSRTFYFSNKYTGFTVKQYKIGNGSWENTGDSVYYDDHLEIRHERNSYELAFYNYQSVDNTQIVKYEAPLSNYDYTPPKPDSLPEGFEFKGWYKDSTLTQKFDFSNGKMPANNLMVYAKWEAPEVKGIWHYDLGNDNFEEDNRPTYNNLINPSYLPTVQDSEKNIVFSGSEKMIILPKNHKWIGWATKEDKIFVSFNFNTRILENIELYPYSVSNDKYTVTYKDLETEFKGVDINQYAPNSFSEVHGFDELEHSREGYSFIGWKSSLDGNIYKPGDKVLMTEDLVFEAQWKEDKSTTKLTYKYGVVSGEDIIKENLLINSKVELPELEKEGYNFIGWMDQKGNYYKPGVEILIDSVEEKDENILTAIWTKTITAQKIWQGGPVEKPDITFNLMYDGSSVTEQSIKIKQESDAGKIEEVYATLTENPSKSLSNGVTEVSWTVDAQTYTDKDKFTVNEVEIENYEATVDGLIVTNKYISPKIDITAKKEWNEGPLVGKEVSLQLFRNDEAFGQPVSTNNLEYTWTELDRKDSNGEEYSYLVKETNIPDGYISEVTGDVENGFTIKNTYTTKEVKITKQVSGNMADTTDIFEFTYKFVSLSDNSELIDDSYKFSLGHGGEHTIDLPIGYKLVVDESDSKGYKIKDGDHTATYDRQNGLSNEVIEFINIKNKEIPTGIHDFASPHIMALTLVALGSVAFIFYKRKAQIHQ